MPFCSKCGFEVQTGDQFCGKCGSTQAAGPVPPGAKKTSAGDPFSSINNNTASVLCYIPFLGWIACIYVLAVDRFRRDNAVRFHAFQGLYLFVAWTIYDWVIEGFVYDFVNSPWVIHRAVRLVMTGTCIYLMYKTSQREVVRLPVIGDLAEQSVAEQR
jgi:uncharacterized membrane protein